MVGRPDIVHGAADPLLWQSSHATNQSLRVFVSDPAREDVVDALVEVGDGVRQIARMTAGEPLFTGSEVGPHVGETGAGQDLVHWRARAVVQIAHQHDAWGRADRGDQFDRLRRTQQRQVQVSDVGFQMRRDERVRVSSNGDVRGHEPADHRHAFRDWPQVARVVLRQRGIDGYSMAVHQDHVAIDGAYSRERLGGDVVNRCGDVVLEVASLERRLEDLEVVQFDHERETQAGDVEVDVPDFLKADDQRTRPRDPIGDRRRSGVGKSVAISVSIAPTNAGRSSSGSGVVSASRTSSRSVPT